jgi:hypothetical protein
MISIAITPEAFEAIRATYLDLADAPPTGPTASSGYGSIPILSTGSAGCARQGESYSDVILRLAAEAT